MQPCALMNGQHRQVGPLSQPSQAVPHLTHNATRNQLAGTANNSRQYQMVNSGVQPLAGAHFISHNGVYSNRQMSNRQPSGGQRLSSEQKCKMKTNHPFLELLLTSSTTDSQIEELCLTASRGLQVPTQQDFHQNSATQSQPNKMYVNNTYNQQNTSPHCKQSAVVTESQPVRIQKGRKKSHLPHSRVLNNWTPGSAYTTTATSSAAAHSRHTVQAAHNQIHQQNSTQIGLSPCIPQAGYSMSTSQPLGNNGIRTHPSPRALTSYVAQLTPACNNGGDSTISSNANPWKQYERNIFLTKTNELSINPAVTHQQMLRHNMSAEASPGSYTTGCNRPPPSYRSTHHQLQTFAGKAGTTVIHQNVQPVLSPVSGSCNLNNAQSLSLHSGQSLPKSSQSSISNSHLVHAQPQQNPAPNVFLVPATGHGHLSSKADNTFLRNDGTASKGNPVGLLSGVSQLMQLLEDVSPQRNKTQSSVANSQEPLEMLSSVKQNDSSIHSSPARSGTRAVAVVQPLPLESCQTAITTGDSLWNPEKVFASPPGAKNRNGENLTKESNLYPENPNQVLSNKSEKSYLAESNDGAVLSKSDSDPLNLQKSVPDIGITNAAKKSLLLKIPANQHCSEDQAEMVKPPTPPVLEHSSLPTTQWMFDALIEVIQRVEKAPTTPEDFTNLSLPHRILHMFWDGSYSTLISHLKMGSFKVLVREVSNFCQTHVKSDTVILSQVIRGFGQELEKHHLLKHDEVYSELPYKSSWLNLNEQLDDIDKEFGFPWTLTSHLPEPDSDSQTDQVETVDSIPEPVGSQVPDKVLLPTELEPVDSGEEKQASTVEAPSTPTASFDETESETSSDPRYSFNIQVLSPKAARRFFEQGQTEMPQSTDTDSQAEEIIYSSVESETPEDTGATLSILESEACEPIEQICCLARVVELFCGENKPWKCRCKERQNDKDGTNETLDREKEAAHKDDSLFETSSFTIFDIQEDDPEEDKENTDGQIRTICSSEPCNEDVQMIDLTDDKGKPDSTCDQESTLEISTSSESSIVFITDGEDEDLPIRENETPIQTPKVATELSEPEYECEQEHPKSTGTMQSSASVCDDKQNESTEHIVTIQMTDRKEGCAQAQLKSADVAKSQMENKEQTQISATADLQTSSSSGTEQETAERGQKRRSSHHTFSPFQKKSKKCKLSVDLSSEHAFHGASKCEKTLVDAVEAQPLSSNVRTVELVLFGSAQQGKCAVIGKRKSHAFPGDETNRPPEVVSVHLSPLKRKSSEAVQRKQSLKQCLHEKWRQSLPPAELWHRNKLKRQKRLSAFVPGVSLKRENSEMRVLHANSKRCRNLKRKRCLSIRLKTGKVKKPNQPDGRERSDTKDGSSKIMPLQENVLKFCVLPKTFDFKDGSHRRKEPTDRAPDKPNHAKEKHQHSSKSPFKVKGSWCPNPEERYKPLCPSPVPKTASVFYEFQKKYVKKVQSSTDKQRD